MLTLRAATLTNEVARTLQFQVPSSVTRPSARSLCSRSYRRGAVRPHAHSRPTFRLRRIIDLHGLVMRLLGVPFIDVNVEIAKGGVHVGDMGEVGFTW